MGVAVNFDKGACVARVEKAATGKALLIASEQVLKDCNFYCKQDQGTLISSSITHSQPEKGILKWVTPYARKQYYLKTASAVPNINACWMWFHKAKAERLKVWLGVYQDGIKKSLGGR